MNGTDTNRQLFEELDNRESDGIEVSLLWSRENGDPTVFVTDARSGECFELPVTRRTARDVFLHPFAYAGPLHPIQQPLASATR